MYKRIYIPVDNSDHSNKAIEIGVDLAKHFGGTIIGSHAYAAKMHDKRFKQMESGLPEEYHDEKELERQRKIHDSLITRGLVIITDCYLDVMDQQCKAANISFERKALEGRNFQVLTEDIQQEKYDLVIMGALGVGAVRDSIIGSVCERVIRRTRDSDFLVVKDLKPMNGNRKIVVAVDGSPHSYGGLKTAITIGKALDMPVEAISAFDPYFHYAMFNSIADVLSEEAGKVFRFKEQEKLHEEIIDSGLAKIYQAHLDISKDEAEKDGMKIKSTLLDGKPFDRVMQYIKKEKPWLLVLGRIGVHSDETMDLGSNTENLLRLAQCNILISNRTFVPAVDTTAMYTIAWTEEASRRMEKVPAFARGVAKTAIHRYAIEKGHSIISNAVVDVAMGHLLPPEAVAAMKGMGKTLDEQGIDRNKMTADDSVVKDLMGTQSAQVMGLMGDTAAASSGENILNIDQRRELDYWTCSGCGHLAKGSQPVKCPICMAEGSSFKIIDKSIMHAAAKTEGNIEIEMAYDDVIIEWTSEAKERLRTVPSGYIRRRTKAIIEKSARKRGIKTITADFTGKIIMEYADEVSWKDELLGANEEKIKAPAPEFEWTRDAKTRLEKVPPGYMRDCTQTMIENHARSKGVKAITLEIADEGIEQAKATMEDAVKDPSKMQEILDKLMPKKSQGNGQATAQTSSTKPAAN